MDFLKDVKKRVLELVPSNAEVSSVDLEGPEIAIYTKNPKDADVKEVMFNTAFSEVVIESIKPGLVIGKGGETSKKIILETGWTPKIIRAPTTPSEILKGLRYHLHKHSNERKKILKATAEKIYAE